MTKAAGLAGLIGLVGTVCVALILAALTGCGGWDSCEQDYLPPRQETTRESPYEIRTLSSDLSITSARWVNTTTGASGGGTLTQVQECVFLFGCGTWTLIAMDIPLVRGPNTVQTFRTSDGCEWREDLQITLI